MAFKFIQEPNGPVLTDEQLLASAIQQKTDKQDRTNDQMLLAGIVFLVIAVVIAAAFLFKRTRRL